VLSFFLTHAQRELPANAILAGSKFGKKSRSKPAARNSALGRAAKCPNLGYNQNIIQQRQEMHLGDQSQVPAKLLTRLVSAGAGRNWKRTRLSLAWTRFQLLDGLGFRGASQRGYRAPPFLLSKQTAAKVACMTLARRQLGGNSAAARPTPHCIRARCSTRLTNVDGISCEQPAGTTRNAPHPWNSPQTRARLFL
jgi:hypothetical protein